MHDYEVGTELDVFVLGPVEVRAEGEPIGLNRPLERALAVRLALADGAGVPDDRLVRDLWGDADLARPTERLRVLASRLRGSLGAAGSALSRSAGGYALRAGPADLVLARAATTRMRAALRAGDRATALAAAVEALGRWRGPAMADLRSVPFLAAEGARLDALRLELLVERFDLELAMDAGVALVGELTRLADEHPLHERLCCLLALALYRSGRQGDALGRLAGLRRLLADELGIDPAADTVAMELRILRQDTALIAPAEPVDRDDRLLEFRLPLPATTFLGRAAERAALLDRLATAGLVTLTGTAGCGKTRLALEVARDVRRSGRPVGWVDLAPLRDPDEVGPALAAAIGVEPGQRDWVRRCAEALRGALLVLDNAEHLVEAVAELVVVVSRQADALSVLVTSQRPLLISGERINPVGPLPATAAAELFCDRSGAPPDADVDAICAAVDRLPLAVELAAGLTRALTVRQLASRIDDRLRLLVGGGRDAGARHTSLRAALDWSHDLLEPTSQVVLRRLAVFAGGWPLEGAESVVTGDGVDVADVPVALADLADRSLVTVADGAHGRRFGLLETIRHYAGERLRVAGEEEELLARHLVWCRAHVAAHDLSNGDGDAATELAALFAEWPNLVRALDCAPGTTRAADGLRLAIALDDAWMVRGLSTEILPHYAALVDAPGVSDRERAVALSNYGFASAQSGRTAQAAALLDRAERLAATVGDDELVMRVLYHRGIAEIEYGRPARAFEPLDRGRELAARLGRPGSSSAFLTVLATAHMYAGALDTALRLHISANQIDRELSDEHGLARGLVNEALVLLIGGDPERALRRAAEAEQIAARLDDAVTVLHVRMIRGRAAFAAGDHDAAADHFRASIERAESGSDTDLVRVALAEVALVSGRVGEARDLVDTVLTGASGDGLAWLVAHPTAAALAMAEGDQGTARSLVRRAAAEYAERGFGWPPATDRLAVVMAGLSDLPAALVADQRDRA
ncbi:MAG TPA: BTAD domain-containing putative transcriptional regulator [Pseudonocardiaceae bacterium]